MRSLARKTGLAEGEQSDAAGRRRIARQSVALLPRSESTGELEPQVGQSMTSSTMSPSCTTWSKPTCCSGNFALVPVTWALRQWPSQARFKFAVGASTEAPKGSTIA